jgi:hypothetical protein
MSDSDNEDLGFNILFGNIGSDGELDADYLGEVHTNKPLVAASKQPSWPSHAMLPYATGRPQVPQTGLEEDRRR